MIVYLFENQGCLWRIVKYPKGGYVLQFKRGEWYNSKLMTDEEYDMNYKFAADQWQQGDMGPER